MSISLAKAELTGVFLESLSYGVYILIFIQCMQVLRRKHTRPNDYLFGTAISLFILATAHWVVDVIRNMDAFTSNMEIPNYPMKYYLAYGTWQDIVKSTLYVTVTVISDAFILYRTFIVWGGSYVVSVVPFLLFLADIAIGILWVYTLSLVSPGGDVFADILSIRVTAFYSVTLCMNFMCTVLIALRIWKIQRAIAPFAKESQDDLSRIVAIVVESGSAYSTILVAMIATYADNSPTMFIFLNTLPPIIGIVFSSVIVRVGLGLSHGDNHSAHMTNSQTQWTVRTCGRETAQEPSGAGQTVGSFPGGGARVALSRTVHTHIDGFRVGEVETDLGSICGDRESLQTV